MIRASEIDRLKKCYRCLKTNTVQIATSESDDEMSLVYCGWCNDCNAPFSYRMRVDIVHDQRGRI